jgi:hypothetical protein
MNEFKDILIAVHGIGAQSRNATVRYVATRLAHSSISMGRPGEPPPAQAVSPQPLGWFYSDVRGAVKVAPLDSFSSPTHPLAGIGFTEVFWADIPQEVVEEGRTIEETKAWARTVVARARAICKNKVAEQETLPPAERLRIIEPDFSLAAEVLEEIIETVYVLENLTFLAGKAGLMKFNLREVLQEYLGDVQIVTEFEQFRTDIVGRFHSAMEQIHSKYPEARLHIVAHSEGTVVSFLGLLHALSGNQVLPATGALFRRIGGIISDSGPKVVENKVLPPWLEKVHGYMTIGSPIDKHILVWPKLFEKFNFKPAQGTFGNGRCIKWRNYYDYGDPVGFKLETARYWLEAHPECKPFEFEETHDHGFARYAMPGKAHNDYWDDSAVFEHFIRDVIKVDDDPARAPRSRPLVYFFSPLIPYVISFVLLVAATFVLYRAVNGYTHPDLDPLQRYIRFMVLGLSESSSVSGARMFLHSWAIAGFIAGITLLTRIPRLAVGWFWWLVGFIGFVAGCASYYFGVRVDSRAEIGSGFNKLGWNHPTLGFLLLGLAVAVISLLFVRRRSYEFEKPGATPRKQRWIFKGMRPLILAGAAAVAFLVFSQFLPHSDLEQRERDIIGKDLATKIDKAHLNRKDLNMLFYGGGTDLKLESKHLESVVQMLDPRPNVWPVLLGGAAFLYLWWLAALIFDLGFVWQRYIRNALSNKRLMTWRGFTEPAKGKKIPVTLQPG